MLQDWMYMGRTPYTKGHRQARSIIFVSAVRLLRFSLTFELRWTYVFAKLMRAYKKRARILFATVSAAAVLSLHDGKPVEEWGSPTISLNTVISALGVVSRATLAFSVSGVIGQHKWNWFRRRQDRLGVFEKFDEASRGPWGSASLLWWSKARNWASLGAFVTIIALLVDPFLQATVTLKGQTDVAISANLLALFSDGLSYSSSGIATGAATARFECSTGNCTWSLYTTAAVCSRCNDLSPEAILKQPGTVQKQSEGYNATDYYTYYATTSGTFRFTNYSLAYGHIMHLNGDIAKRNGLGEELVLLTAFMNADYTTSVSFRELDTTIATLLILRAGEDYQHRNAKWEDSRPTATECGLYICAKAYQASASNGVLAETEVAVSSPALPQPDGAPIQRAFNVTQGTIRGLQATMSSLFQVSRDAVEANPEFQRPAKAFLVYPNNNPLFSNDVPDILFHSANLASTFDDVARRLTVQFRESSNATHAGREDKYVLHIQVEWGFFVLLVVTLAVGCLYFVGVLIQTHRLKLSAWKESAYPVLGCGFGEETQSRLRMAEQAAYRSRAARRDREQMRVALLDVEGGYRLVHVVGPSRASP
ncbi:hypothetical protein B0T18DRAFT_386415 [Schizothecium vesticola]|uniref:Uncharacterized protein n=1 Tax=Schizothecium vesticola TaxID=314040 RepID=A0AA40KCX2_9PEZI|nr:hypothetical protein B0T18DRAFT_386415 [Schizothecium vesticola]